MYWKKSLIFFPRKLIGQLAITCAEAISSCEDWSLLKTWSLGVGQGLNVGGVKFWPRNIFLKNQLAVKLEAS